MVALERPDRQIREQDEVVARPLLDQAPQGALVRLAVVRRSSYTLTDPPRLGLGRDGICGDGIAVLPTAAARVDLGYGPCPGPGRTGRPLFALRAARTSRALRTADRGAARYTQFVLTVRFTDDVTAVAR